MKDLAISTLQNYKYFTVSSLLYLNPLWNYIFWVHHPTIFDWKRTFAPISFTTRFFNNESHCWKENKKGLEKLNFNMYTKELFLQLMYLSNICNSRLNFFSYIKNTVNFRNFRKKGQGQPVSFSVEWRRIDILLKKVLCRNSLMCQILQRAKENYICFAQIDTLLPKLAFSFPW